MGSTAVTSPEGIYRKTVFLAFCSIPELKKEEYKALSVYFKEENCTSKTPSPEVALQFRLLYPFHNTKRYRPVPLAPRQEVIDIFFYKAFEHFPDPIIGAAEKIDPTNAPFYPRWKNIHQIKIPHGIARFMQNPLIKIGVFFYTFFSLCKVFERIYKIYQATVDFSPLIHRLPAQIVQISSLFTTTMRSFFSHYTLEILLGFWIIREVILLGPEIPYVTALARKINLRVVFCFLVFSFEDTKHFLHGEALVTTCFLTNIYGWIQNSLGNIASNRNHERLEICREKAYHFWKQLA